MAQDHRARQYASTHQRIYDAAMELFARHGYEDVSIARLAAAAGVSVQTFYAHYPGKDELLMALPERAEIDALARWRVITATPRLRYRAAEYERATAQMFLESLGEDLQADPAATVVVTAHMSAYTQALLRWAESGGELPLADVVEEALDALRGL